MGMVLKNIEYMSRGVLTSVPKIYRPSVPVETIFKLRSKIFNLLTKIKNNQEYQYFSF